MDKRYGKEQGREEWMALIASHTPSHRHPASHRLTHSVSSPYKLSSHTPSHRHTISHRLTHSISSPKRLPSPHTSSHRLTQAPIASQSSSHLHTSSHFLTQALIASQSSFNRHRSHSLTPDRHTEFLIAPTRLSSCSPLNLDRCFVLVGVSVKILRRKNRLRLDSCNAFSFPLIFSFNQTINIVIPLAALLIRAQSLRYLTGETSYAIEKFYDFLIWFRRSTATRLGFVLSVRKKTRADRHHLFSIGEVKSNPFASRQA
ncbi:hypothetical protein Bca4012_099272 [Brassica carinata]